MRTMFRTNPRAGLLHLARLALLTPLALWALGAAAPAHAAYPDKVVRLIVPFPPGGGIDVFSRTLAEKLRTAWGQPVIIDNRGGGGGTPATDAVAKAAPDGYTLLMGFSGNFVMAPWMFLKFPFDPVADFAPITLVARAQVLLLVHPSVPANTVRELVALAKAKPGGLNYASSGIGTVGHVATELFKSVTQTNMVHVPYKGSAFSVADLVAGHVQVMSTTPSGALPFVLKKQLRALAVTGKARMRDLPDVPTFAEAGYPNMDASGWYGFVAPAGTPRELVNQIHNDVGRIMQMADVRERFETLGYAPETSTSEEFAQIIRADLVKWRDVIRAAGIKPE